MSETYLDLGRPLWEAVMYGDIVAQAAAIVIAVVLFVKK